MATDSPAEWYYGLPIVSRVWLSGAVLAALGSKFGLFSPWTVAFIPHLVFKKYEVRVGLLIFPYRRASERAVQVEYISLTSHAQIWRLILNFVFFGDLSFNWLIRMIML